eukprot:247576-Pleurochrysis_carterae.AAC.1
MLGLPPGSRVALRTLPPVRQERFIAKHDVLQKLRQELWTVQAELDIGLFNFIPVRSMEEMRLILSKKQHEDGRWYQPV